MKRLVRLLLLFCLALALVAPAYAFKGSRGSHSSSKTFHSSRRASTSKKSHVRGSNDGTFQGGKGSSHKGGHYKNSKTGNHYRDRKAGTPK